MVNVEWWTVNGELQHCNGIFVILWNIRNENYELNSCLFFAASFVSLIDVGCSVMLVESFIFKQKYQTRKLKFIFIVKCFCISLLVGWIQKIYVFLIYKSMLQVYQSEHYDCIHWKRWKHCCTGTMDNGKRNEIAFLCVLLRVSVICMSRKICVHISNVNVSIFPVALHHFSLWRVWRMGSTWKGKYEKKIASWNKTRVKIHS